MYYIFLCTLFYDRQLYELLGYKYLIYILNTYIKIWTIYDQISRKEVWTVRIIRLLSIPSLNWFELSTNRKIPNFLVLAVHSRNRRGTWNRPSIAHIRVRERLAFTQPTDKDQPRVMCTVQCTYILGIVQMLNLMFDLVPAESCFASIF